MIKKIKKTIGTLVVLLLLFCIHTQISYAITPAGEGRYQGIDVSNWQGYINYQQVRETGIEIVYIKSSQGTEFKDPYFETNYTNAKENGLRVGFYHFLTATNTEQARQEAQFFSSVISGKSPDCRLAMDFEQFRGGISRDEINDISDVFLQTVQQLTGKEVIVYSDLYDSQVVFSRELASRYPLWLAYYGDYNLLDNVESSWDNWYGVQYTNRGIVSGVRGYVDRNVFTNEIFLSDNSNLPNIEYNNSSPNTQTIDYTVRRGDTLSQIALRYGTTVQEIVDLNNIQNPNLIFPGQVLRILTNSTVNGNETNEVGHIVYTVRRGNTLSQIALRYGTTVQEIADLNMIRNPNLIFPGQKLRIDISAGSTTPDNNEVTYVVRRGNTLSGIARYYGVSVEELVNLNNIQNPNLIYPGQIIRIR